MSIEAGKTYSVACPFIRAPYTGCDEDGYHTELSWKPGIVWESMSRDYEEADARAHGMGYVSYTVVSVVDLPRPYPKRVFFTRKWTTPDGRTFGKNRLVIMTADQFKRRLDSYKPSGVDQFTNFIVADLSEPERAAILGKVNA